MCEKTSAILKYNQFRLFPADSKQTEALRFQLAQLESLLRVTNQFTKKTDNFSKAKEITLRQVKRDKAVKNDLLDAIDHHVVLRALSHFM